MLWVWVPAHDFHVTADALRRRIARVILCGSAVDFLQLGVVAIHSECAFDGFKVSAVTVCSDLHAASDPAGAIVHKVHCPSRIPSAYEVRNDHLGIGVDSNPRPNIAPAFLLLFGAGVLCLGSDELPNLVGL